jgi:RND family efflux transporter MFP subunit
MRKSYIPITLLFTVIAFSPSASSQVAAVEPLDCLLEPYLEVDVGSPAFGILATVNVDRGDTVVKGQVIAQLESATQAAGVKLAEARAEFNKRKVARNDDLYRDELISIHEKDEIETQSLISDLELLEAREELNKRTIRSPLNGIVVDRFLSRGEYVQELPVVKLAQINPLNVDVIAPVELFGSVEVGSTAQLELAPPLSGTYTVKVVIVDRVIDAASGTFGIRLALPNPGNKIPSGLNCTVRIEGGS